MKRMRKVFRSEEGFTLIELLIVIAVLGILAGIAVPRITGVRDEASKSALKATATTIKNSMEMYNAVYGEYPAQDAGGQPINSISELKTALSTKPSGSTVSSDISLSIDVSGVTLDGTSSFTTNSYSIQLNDSDSDYYVTFGSDAEISVSS